MRADAGLIVSASTVRSRCIWRALANRSARWTFPNPPSNARNAHFEDELRDGELHFDYRLREGVVRRSNALALMRSVGLELDTAAR